MKKIIVVTPTFNEEDNIPLIHAAVKKVFETLPYEYVHLFIDNCSTDKSQDLLRGLASTFKNVQVIMNVSNFGHVRSPYYGMITADGDAVVMIGADLEEPPELIADFIQGWQDGYKVVAGVRTTSHASFFLNNLKKIFYKLLNFVSSSELIENFTGFGLYDRSVIDLIKEIDDRNPYFRGMVSELGFPVKKIQYTQNKRQFGVSKNNFLTLYDSAMLGLTSNSYIAIRLMSFVGFFVGIISFFLAIYYLVMKIIYWNSFDMGVAPLVIGMYMIMGIILFFLGLLGEYIRSIHIKSQNRPVVVVKELINFE
jgi:glycosyltransferase involved in cell wall biosynthesis